MAVNVDAIDRMLRARSAPHVREKGFVRMKPSFAHRDTAPTVVLESNVFGIKTARLYSSPDVVFVCGGAPSAFSVGSGATSSERTFAAETSTALRSPGAQVATPGDYMAAAVAVALPKGGTLGTGNSTYCNQSSKPNAAQILRGFHHSILTHVTQ